METPLEPEALREREDVEFETEHRTVTGPEFETARDLESRVTVGITNGAGEVLLVADGARGWTLPAVPVDPDGDWAGSARTVIDSVTGVDGTLAEPVRVRAVEFRQEGTDRERTTYNVLVRTEPVSGRPTADEPTVAGDEVGDLLWIDRVPEDELEGVAGDVRAVLERAGTN